MDTIQETKVELSSNCECAYCPTCDVGVIGSKCADCNGETRAQDYCDEFCYDYKISELEDQLIPAYCDANGLPTHFEITGSSMGWTRASGSCTVEATWKDLFEALTINGEWTLRFTFAGDSMKVSRYSHDEPTGASFIVLPAIITEDE